MKKIILLLAALPSLTFANDNRYNSVRDNVFWPKLYNKNHHTLYCAVSRTAGEKVTVEHVYPASWIAEANGCEDRNSCDVEAYKQASSDLYNLWPALGRYNKSRGNKPFIEIEGENWRWPEDQCDYETSRAGVEPREWARGEIARSMLYMFKTYNLPDHGLTELMNKWDKQYPVSREEKWRNELIPDLQ